MTAIIDVEATHLKATEAKLRYFGGIDVKTGSIVMYDHTRKEEIGDYLKQHKVLIGFNIKGYDKKVLENYGIDFKYKVIFDLWEALAPKGQDGFGKFNKDRLKDINPELKFKNYKLKTIVQTLNIDSIGKGNIDYSVFLKESWTQEETKEIELYLKQDLYITKKLFDWYVGIFKPLEQFLSKEEVTKFKHLSCTSGVLAYKIICHIAKIKPEWSDSKERTGRIEGGHHIHPRWEKVRGNIVGRDFVSHYPTILISGNLFSPTESEGWKGSNYFDIKGTYSIIKQGKIELALKQILEARLEAKRKGDKATATALKVPLNSVYGITGNPAYKNLYNPTTAADCTSIGRTLLKKCAKTLDVAGFVCLYGFTDSIYIGIPKQLNETDLDLVLDYFIKDSKKYLPFPIDSFNIATDKKIKFMWFVERKDNNYLWVDSNNKTHIKGCLFDVNCPKSVLRVFDNYISSKICKELDVNFTETELTKELENVLSEHPELSAEDYSVKDISTYKVTTSLQYQISERYGSGVHALIPNNKNIGVGRNKDLKYCSIKEFKENKLGVSDISIFRMKQYLKPFHTTQKEVLEL